MQPSILLLDDDGTAVSIEDGSELILEEFSFGYGGRMGVFVVTT